MAQFLYVSCLQPTIGAILEKMVSHLQLVESNGKQMGAPVIRKELKERIRSVLKSIAKCLRPSIYFKIVIQLLGHADINVKKKVKEFGYSFIFLKTLYLCSRSIDLLC